MLSGLTYIIWYTVPGSVNRVADPNKSSKHIPKDFLHTDKTGKLPKVKKEADFSPQFDLLRLKQDKQIY